MPLEDFIIAVLCCVEDMWHESPAPSRLRQRGFAPKLSDSEVLTMEIVGAKPHVEQNPLAHFGLDLQPFSEN